MAVMEEKNQLTAELDRVRRQMESIQSERDRLINELDRIRRQTSLAESLELTNLSSKFSFRFHFHQDWFIYVLVYSLTYFKLGFSASDLLDWRYFGVPLFCLKRTESRNCHVVKGCR